MNVKNCMLASLVKIITLKMTSVKVVQHKLTSFFSRTNRPVTIESPAKDIREPEVLITGDFQFEWLEFSEEKNSAFCFV